jgi:hypothetical protein
VSVGIFFCCCHKCQCLGIHAMVGTRTVCHFPPLWLLWLLSCDSDLVSCDSCDCCDSCDTCDSCNSCDSCDSCDFCCDSLNACDSYDFKMDCFWGNMTHCGTSGGSKWLTYLASILNLENAHTLWPHSDTSRTQDGWYIDGSHEHHKHSSIKTQDFSNCNFSMASYS